MARIRTIKPEFPQSESMGRVSRDARLLFIELWTLCDDEGRTRAASRMLASLLFPYDDGEDGHVRTTAADIDRWLVELEHEGCIIRYQVDGAAYLQVCKWLNHQKIDKPSKSKIPPPDEHSIILAKPREPSALDQGSRIKDQGEEKPLGASAPSGTVLETDPERLEAIEATLQANLVEPTPVPKREKPVDEDFERAWALYPKRDGGNPKQDAMKAWNARRKEGVPSAEMIAGVERYAEHMKARGKLGTEYVMQAVRFFGTSKQYAEPWPAGQGQGGSKFQVAGLDHSSTVAAMHRSREQMGIDLSGPDDDDVSFDLPRRQ